MQRPAAAAVVLFGIVGTTTVLLASAAAPPDPPKKWGTVVDGVVYRSGQIAKDDIYAALTDHDIQLVVDFTSELPGYPDQMAEIGACNQLGIERVRLPLGGDGQGDPEHYVTALTLMKRAADERAPVLIHCSAGAQRTGAATALYRVLLDGWTPAQARLEMTRYGWHPHKDRELLDFLDQHMATITHRLVEGGVLPQVPRPLPRMSG